MHLLRRLSKGKGGSQKKLDSSPRKLVAVQTAEGGAATAVSDDAVRLPDGSVLLDEESECTSPRRTATAGETESSLSCYGSPLSGAQAAELCPPGDCGIVWHAQLLADGDALHCDGNGGIKPRRAELPVRAADFFRSLVRTPDGRYIFSGVLNGWSGLTCLEVRVNSFARSASLDQLCGRSRRSLARVHRYARSPS